MNQNKNFIKKNKNQKKDFTKLLLENNYDCPFFLPEIILTQSSKDFFNY